jgi:hypothetical protein
MHVLWVYLIDKILHCICREPESKLRLFHLSILRVEFLSTSYWTKKPYTYSYIYIHKRHVIHTCGPATLILHDSLVVAMIGHAGHPHEWLGYGPFIFGVHFRGSFLTSITIVHHPFISFTPNLQRQHRVVIFRREMLAIALKVLLLNDLKNII